MVRAATNQIYDEELMPGKGIRSTEREEERLRKAALRRMKQRRGELEQEGRKLESGLAAAAGRGAAAAAGRRSGIAGGGGKMAALAGIESDLALQAAESRAMLGQKLYDADMGALQFERETMKSSAQQRQEAQDHQDALNQMYKDSRTLGVLDNTGFDKRVDDYIRRMGLSTEEARKLKQSQQTMEDNESFFF